MIERVIKSFNKLKKYCEQENFKGWDPYDGLNSKLFQATPLKHSKFARLAWIQLFKRNPINLRPLFKVPKEYNPKGIGLFLTGYCNLYKIAESGITDFGTQDEILEKINHLANLLIELQSEGYSGSCWGYNFDWQNRVFFQPKHIPTVVVTSFCGESLFNAYEITENEEYLNTALSSCDFITQDLNRTKIDGEDFIFSYSPKDNSQVYNASLLGAKLLAKGYSYTENEEWLNLSKRATNTIVSKQGEDGSWIYGEAKVQDWVDSFHTGFNLECIWKVMQNINTPDFQKSFEKGMQYYLDTFFLKSGKPKYYNNRTYPIDIHSPAQLIATLSTASLLRNHRDLADKVLTWTIKNMQAQEGYFYYQLKKIISSKIPYIRWAQAWMFYALTEYLKTFGNENLD